MKDFPLFRSLKAGLIGLPLMLLPLAINIVMPEMAVINAFWVMALMPIASCMAGLIGGAAPMLAGVFSGIASLYLTAGVPGAQVGAVYFLPIIGMFVAVILRRIPFWKSCAAMIGVHVMALAGCYLLLQKFTGGQLYTAAGDGMIALIPQGPYGDAVLYSFYEMGLITLPSALKDTLIKNAEGVLIMGEAARADLLLSLRTLINSLVVNFTPSFIVTQSIMGGVCCLLLPLRFGYIAAQRRDFIKTGEDKEPEAFPDLGMPPLSLWYIPRGWGWKAGLALIGGPLLQQSATLPLSLAGLILSAVGQAVFVLQGLAVINFVQKAKGTARHWRVIVPILLYAFSILHILGIFDQITNARRLRKPPEPKEDI